MCSVIDDDGVRLKNRIYTDAWHVPANPHIWIERILGFPEQCKEKINAVL